MTVDDIHYWLVAYVAKHQKISVDTVNPVVPFTDLGLDSLALVVMTEDLGRMLGKDVDPTVAYEHETIAALSRFLIEADSGPSSTGLAQRQTQEAAACQGRRSPMEDAHDHRPLSSGQEAMWFAEELVPGTPVNNLACALSLVGDLNMRALGAALTEIVRRHQILRSCYRRHGNGVARVVLDPYVVLEDVAIERSDLRIDPHTQALTAAKEFSQVPIDLSAAPPLRAGIISYGVQRHLLVLVCHHIAFDGWSLGVFFKELSTFYGDYLSGRRPSLPDPGLQFADHVERQERLKASAAFRAGLRFWIAAFTPPPQPLDLPPDRPRPASTRYVGRSIDLVVPATVVQSCHELAQRQATSLFAVLMAAYQVLLARLARQRDIVVGTPVTQRSDPAFESAIGLFVNTIAIRSTVDPRKSFSDFVDQVSTFWHRALSYRHVPFDLVVNQLNPQRDTAMPPLYQTLLVFQNFPQPEIALPGLDTRYHSLDTGTTRFDLSLILEQRATVLEGRMEYRTDLYEDARVHWFAQSFLAFLQSAVEAPDVSMRRL